jgi:hypothetical protein
MLQAASVHKDVALLPRTSNPSHSVWGAYITRREGVGKHVKVPADYLGDNRPAQMLMIVDGQFKLEYLQR